MSQDVGAQNGNERDPVLLADTIAAASLAIFWMIAEMINHRDTDLSRRNLRLGQLLMPIWVTLVLVSMGVLVADIVIAATGHERLEATQPVAIAALLSYTLRNWLGSIQQRHIERGKMARMLHTRKLRYGNIPGGLRNGHYVIDPDIHSKDPNTWHHVNRQQQQVQAEVTASRISFRTKKIWKMVREMTLEPRLVKAAMWADWLPTNALENLDWSKVMEIKRVRGASKSSLGLSLLTAIGWGPGPGWSERKKWERDGWLMAALWAAECNESLDKVWDEAQKLIPCNGEALPTPERFCESILDLMLDKNYRTWGVDVDVSPELNVDLIRRRRGGWWLKTSMPEIPT